MNIVLMGPPGGGKGTQARYLEEKWHLVHISTGDMLRAAVSSGSELGQRVEAVMGIGELVSDDLMMELVKERLQQPDALAGWLLDGFPRTEAQAAGLVELLDQIEQTIDAVLVIMVPDEEIVHRLTSRVTCRVCNKIMNINDLAPELPGVCPACGAETDPETGAAALFQRDDDKEDTIRHRLDVFATETMAAAHYLQQRFGYHEIGGQGTPEEIAKKVGNVLG